MAAVKIRMTLANRITMARLLGIPVFVLMLVYYRMSLAEGRPEELYRVFALLLFAAVALTDALDGYVARTRNEVTDLGRILDPLADKALLLSALAALMGMPEGGAGPRIPVWFALLAVSRDALLLLGVVVIHYVAGVAHVRPRVSGKVATALQMAVVAWALAPGPRAGFAPLVWVAGACTLAAGIQYGLDGLRQIEEKGKG